MIGDFSGSLLQPFRGSRESARTAGWRLYKLRRINVGLKRSQKYGISPVLTESVFAKREVQAL